MVFIGTDEQRTRERVLASVSEHGPITAAEVGRLLGLTPAAVRRHLDALLATGRIEERQGAPGVGGAQRGRGRPARYYHLTDVGRSAFPHAYDDLALTALRYVAASGGPDAVRQLVLEDQRARNAICWSVFDAA